MRQGFWPPVLALALATGALAQETTAGIQGSIRDPSRAAVANAAVEVSGPSLIGTRKVRTDAEGYYRVVSLPSGTYAMTISGQGFRTFRYPHIELTVGRLPTLDILLELGAVTEVVEVSSAGPVVDMSQSKVQITVEKSILDNIPKGRSFESVIPFAPGARQEPLQGANGFQIDGASDGENVYLIDGINTTNMAVGGVGKSFQMDFIQEVQIKSSSFEAEYGGALGGVVDAVPKRGSNQYHGSLFTYYRTNALNANNGDRSLRTNPLLPSLNPSARLDAVPEYYNAAKDQQTIAEPGFEIGGPFVTNRLWFYAGYVPQLSTTHRTTTFIGPNPGPRTLTQTSPQHNGYTRLDYGVLSSLRMFASWNYAYSRTTGQLGNQDSNIPGQRNTGATTDPATFRADSGSVNPLSLMSFGGDWTPTARLVISARYGYFFNNTEARGAPSGLRYVYGNTINAAGADLAGQSFPSSSFNLVGFANIPSNLAIIYDAFKRKSANLDISYFTHAAGAHTFKAGFFRQSQENEVLRNFNGGNVVLNWGLSYTPVTDATACDAIKAQNLTQFGKPVCQGRYGYFVIGNNPISAGADRQTAKALYVQDAWQVARGLTLNLGVRLDTEFQPPYDPARYPALSFGWGDKIAPRIGGAYDVARKGKVKIFASYGRFYDIMKMALARGAFGSDYWHNCVYALDDTDYSKIVPTYPLGGGCPASGPAPGVNVGRFIENVNLRGAKADPRDPPIAPGMKPMLQHEYVAGLAWAINAGWSLETRYSRKRLDRTIEDMSITDNLGYYVGNPGTPFADVLHRPVSIPCPGAGCTPDQNGNYVTTTVFCAECPRAVPAIRRYDGAEFRLARRSSGRWFGSVNYAYSRLTGNYAGLTNTDPTDAGGGRHAPNGSRDFDLPTMSYDPNGQISDGPLSTDRPHTASGFAFYRFPWAGMETLVGVTQFAFQGTPIGSCLPVIGTSSACQWAEGRGNFVKLSRAPGGSIVQGDVVHDARTDPLVQTDLAARHEVRMRESYRLELEANVSNLFNQRASTVYYEYMIPANLVSPSRPSRFPGDPGLDWSKVTHVYNYIDALNATGAFAGVQSKLTLASRYGMPSGFQNARTVRLALRFRF